MNASPGAVEEQKNAGGKEEAELIGTAGMRVRR